MLSVLRARGSSPSPAVAHAATAGCLGLAWAEKWLWLVVALVLLGGALLASVARRSDRRAADVRATLLAILFPGWCLACCLALGQLRDGARLVIFLYAVVELGDCFALLVGRFFGKRLIWPRLSPKKTLAGSVAGLAAAVGGAGLFSFLMPGLSLAGCLVAGAAIGLLGQAADLAASAVKRWAGVKDDGALVPTHGGVLDVYDSFILTAPVWFLACVWFG